MNVKGIFFVTTKTVITHGFGEERCNSFMTNLVKKDEYFSKIIMAVSLVPIEKVFVFFDEMSNEFFNNDKKMAYEICGRSGAKYVLQDGGMYHSYLLISSIRI